MKSDQEYDEAFGELIRYIDVSLEDVESEAHLVEIFETMTNKKGKSVVNKSLIQNWKNKSGRYQSVINRIEGRDGVLKRKTPKKRIKKSKKKSKTRFVVPIRGRLGRDSLTGRFVSLNAK